MNYIERIERGDYFREPCDKCDDHMVALIHGLNADGVEHIGYFIVCDAVVSVSWLASSPLIDVYDSYFRKSVRSLRRD